MASSLIPCWGSSRVLTGSLFLEISASILALICSKFFSTWLLMKAMLLSFLINQVETTLLKPDHCLIFNWLISILTKLSGMLQTTVNCSQNNYYDWPDQQNVKEIITISDRDQIIEDLSLDEVVGLHVIEENA